MRFNSEYRVRIAYSPEGEGGAPAPVAPAPAPAAPAPAADPAPAPAAPAPWGSDVNGEWKIGDKLWYEHLPDSPTKDLYRAKNYKNPVIAADSHYAANKSFVEGGDTRIAVPAADAPQEQWDAYYDKRGRLDSPEKYAEVFKAPEGQQLDPSMVKIGSELAHKLGLTPAEASRMQTLFDSSMSQVLAADAETQRVANEAAVDALKAKWGGDAAWNENVEAGKRAVQALGFDPAAVEALDRAMGTAPVLDLFARLGNMSKEGKFVSSPTASPGGAQNPANMDAAQASAEIARLQADPTFQASYLDANHPSHKNALERMSALYAKAGDKAL